MIRLYWAVRLLISAALLTLLFALLPFQELWEAVRRVPPGLMVVVLAAFLMGHVVAAMKWRLLMSEQHARLPPLLFWKAHFAGLIANLCLPTIAGGDLVRATWVVARVGHPEAVAVAGVADRAIDVLALLMLAGAGLVWTGTFSGAGGRVFGIVAFLLLGAVILIMMMSRLPSANPGTRREFLAAALRVLVGRPLRMASVLAMSLTIQGAFVGLNYWLGQPAGVGAEFAAWLVAWPLSKLVGLVPLSLAGLGVREAALIAFMRPFGAPAAAVLAAGLAWEAVLVAGGLIGWAVTWSLKDEWPLRNSGPAAL